VSKQSDRMSRARSRLLQRAAWYGGVSLKLDMHESNKVPTAATDGKVMPFNPTYTETLNDQQCITLVAHETGHPAFGHTWRYANRADHDLCNMACDYWLNEQLEKDGFEPLPNWLRDTKFDGMTVEQILGILKREEREEPEKFGPRKQQADDNGSDMLPPPPPDEDTDNTDEEGNTPGDKPSDKPSNDELEWQIAGEEAKMVADKRGEMSGAAARAIDAMRKPKADPWATLRRFVERHGEPTDLTWSKPNRRMLAATDVYLPGWDNPNMAPIIIAIDTSGSVTQQLLDIFSGHITHIMEELKPKAIHVIYCDARVNGTSTHTPEDGTVRLKMMGGGGTAFQPVFDYISNHPGEYGDAACIVYLTDADGDNASLTDTANLPTLWGITPGYSRPLPFGEVVKLY
jgi:predicted metal-dependent peptidase